MSESNALNQSRKRARVEADVAPGKVAVEETSQQQDEELNDVEKCVQRFLNAVAKNPNEAKKLLKESKELKAEAALSGMPEPESTATASTSHGYVGKKYDVVDNTQKYVLLSVVGPDVANKAYNEKNELIDYHGLVVWGCVDSLESEFYKDLMRKSAASSGHAFHVLAMPTCCMVPLKFSEDELRGVVNSSWQDERVQELMDGVRRQRANAETFFQQQKEARERGETTPELLQEQLDRLYQDKQRIKEEEFDLDTRINDLKHELNQ